MTLFFRIWKAGYQHKTGHGGTLM